MNPKLRGHLAIHVAVLLFGVAGLFGKFLHISPAVIVLGRTLFASIALLAAAKTLKIDLSIRQTKDVGGFLLLGAILAAHWVTFFQAIQISTVAIGLLTFSTFPVFVVFLEPLFFREPIRRLDVAISLIVFAGLLLVIPDFDLGNNLTQGAVWGTISGLTFAILSILNRRYVSDYSPLTVALYQDGVACLLLLPIAGNALLQITPIELAQLITLGVVFTAVAHTLFIAGMEQLRAQLASLIASLEPVYGIGLAAILLGEIPSPRELLGGTLIIGAIIYATQFAVRADK